MAKVATRVAYGDALKELMVENKKCRCIRC